MGIAEESSETRMLAAGRAIMIRRRIALYLDDGLVCGGAERVATHLLARWAKDGWETYLISRSAADSDFYLASNEVQRLSLYPPKALHPAGSEGGFGKRLRLSLLRHIPARSFLRLAWESLLLRRALRTIRPDIAVAFLTPANVKLIVAGHGLGCRLIVSERNDTRLKEYPRMWKIFRACLYRRADLITANNRNTLQDMERYVPREKLLELPNPVELPPADALAEPARSMRIVAVGRLIPEKQHGFLIEAFSGMGAEFRGWELDLIGDGVLRSTLEEAIATRSLHSRAHLHGFQRDVSLYYRQGAIFVLTSRFEGMPNALLEAMAHGLPCVVPRNLSGATAHVDDGKSGLLFDSDNVSSLTDALEKLAMSPSLRSAMGNAARRRMECSNATQAFETWSRAIESTLKGDKCGA